MTTRSEPAQRRGGARTDLRPHTYPISLFLFLFPRWPWIGDSSPTTPMACLESRGAGRTTHRHHHIIIPLVIPPYVWCLVFPVLVPAVRLFTGSIFPALSPRLPPRFGISRQTSPLLWTSYFTIVSIYFLCHYCTTLSHRILLAVVPHLTPHHPTPY